MTYEVLDTERGDVLANYEDEFEARASLREYVKQHPELVNELAVASIDEDGNAVQLEPASSLLEHA